MQPVAHGVIDAKIGAKKIEMKKQMPVVTISMLTREGFNKVLGAVEARQRQEAEISRLQLSGHFLNSRLSRNSQE